MHTARDIATGSRASGDEAEFQLANAIVIEAGDVLMPRVVSVHGGRVRVADDADAGCLLGVNVHLFRLDPERLVPWFLAGFLSAEDNVSSASSGSTSVHLEPGRLRVPLLPLAGQRRYGAVFRRLHDLRVAARQAADAAEENAAWLAAGPIGGALLPPEEESG
ncbi:hypothetical protein [Streptomyces sp. NPDC005004]